VLTSGSFGMVMMIMVAERCLVRWLANSTVETMFPMVGVEMKTTSNLVKMIEEGKSHYFSILKIGMI